MSQPVLRDVCLEEGSVLNLIREYFEVGGHAECLLALEHSCNGVTPQPNLPLELTVLREIILAGQWEHLMKYLERFKDAEGSEEGLKRCRYLAHRQKYLEILHHVESDIQDKLRLGFSSYCEHGKLLGTEEAVKIRNIMEAELEALESLCPSPEEYQSLRSLLSMPSISSSKEFCNWRLHSGRVDTLYEIQDWITKTLYLNVRFPLKECKEDGGVRKSCSLLRLLAKGILYEQCERLCRARCGDPPAADEDLSILDLKGWIQHQPDSSFQLQPSQLNLLVTPWTRPTPSLVVKSVDMGVMKKDKRSSVLLEPSNPAAKSVSAFHNLTASTHISSNPGRCPTSNDRVDQPATTKASSANSANSSQVASESQGGHGTSATRSHGGVVEDGQVNMAEARSKSPSKSSSSSGPASRLPSGNTDPGQSKVVLPPLVPAIPAASEPTNASAQPSLSNVILPSKQPSEMGGALAKDTKKSPHPCARSELENTEPDCPPQPPNDNIEASVLFTSTTPLRKTGRGSSTPKNPKASRASLKTSPPSSPIAALLAPNSPNGFISSAAGQKENGVGSEEMVVKKRIDFTGAQEKQKWPVVSLLNTVTDAQVWIMISS